MIIICGDLHANFWAVNKLIAKKSKISTIIQCGDFGYFPKEHKKTYLDNIGRIKTFDQYKLKNKDIPIYWCDGNHEDHDSLEKLENNEIMRNVFYQKRGSSITIPDSRTILFIGGADSIDKKYRTAGHNWFPQEIISEKDLYNLPDINIDIIISHTCPEEFDVLKGEKTSFSSLKYAKYKDPSRERLSYVLNKYNPSLWYFGHFHIFKTGFDKNCKWNSLSGVGLGKWWVKLEDKIK